MLRIKDIPTIYDQCENKDLRCLVALPNDSQTYILDDYDEGWDWETEQATYETDLVLVDRETLVVKRVTFDNDKRILRDENHIRVLEDRIEDRVERIFAEAKFVGRTVTLQRVSGLGVFENCELIHADGDRSLVFISALCDHSNNLQILVLTSAAILTRSEDNGTYLLDGEYFVNTTSLRAPKTQGVLS